MRKTLQAQRPQVQTATPELRAWIVAQAQAGCRPEDVLASMISSGWDEDVAIAAMEDTLSTHLAKPRAVVVPGEISVVPTPHLAGAPSRVHLGDREVAVLMQMALPRVLVLGGFLSDDECDEMVALAGARLARSETVVNETGGSEVNTTRTSDGMFFTRGEHPVCGRIERRIATLLNWPVENGEGLQVLRYRPGAEYQAHHDYFDPTQPGAPSILARGGQRVGTLVMYLNTPERGGATTFPDVGLEVGPIKGNAVFFSYDRADAATKTLHAGAPVLAGEKWVATKWLRQREFN
jgi:prolyl 4-hydroxylase